MPAPAPGSGLPLRDIHQPPAPPFWPPAPGWWLVAGLLLLGALLLGWMAWRRHRRRLAMARLFDTAVDQAPDNAAKVAAMSQLLRRAARRIDPAADRLAGDAWLALLDGDRTPRRFAGAQGALLADGGFRPTLGDAEVDALRPLARARFLEWTQ